MTRFQALVLLSALCLLRVDALSLRSLVENPFLPQPVHRRLASCPLTSGVDYLGNDIKYVSSVKVTDCCTLCSQTSGCGAFTWTDHQGGTCWLKSAKGNTAANAAATSAVLVEDSAPCTLKDGYDYQGNDIANVQSNNAGACCSICSSWPGCKAFTWTNQNSGTCWLKSKKGSEVPKAGAKSAEVQTTVSECKAFQYDLDYINYDIGNAPGKAYSDCCSICHNWNGCRSFSWSNANGGTCWLKSAKGQTQYKVGVVSSQMLDNPLPCELEANKDYVGNDIDNVPESKPADCCDKCRARTGCRAFTWSNHNTGTCWLKSGKGSTVTKSGVTSAVVF
ncbi:PAN domain [Phytophthora infestans]|uniref:PAN domain n=1 Tax=Phytophthora infestans TaxID=4787 RepID=A0A833S482_PHYIN|nr:PAN domain [Phytophthora infestans]